MDCDTVTRLGRVSVLNIGWVLAGFALCAVAAPSNPASPAASYRTIIDRYCVVCHDQKLKTAGLELDTLDLTKVPEHAATWLAAQLDAAARAHPHPGRPVLHRLNRAEYGNAIRDLLALDVDAASLLPPDDSAYGFDNISDVLGLSPALQEYYLRAALKIGSLAVGDAHASPRGETYRVRQDLSQDQHIEGMPLGTIGGTRVRQNFPLDGEYVFQARLYRTNLNIMRGLESPHQVEFTVDGQRIH